MDKSIDLGAIILYILFAGVVFFLVYALFDIKNIFGKARTLVYESGLPEHKELESSKGIIVVKDNDVAFKESEGDKVFFSVPLEQIGDVRTGYGRVDPSNNIMKSMSKLFDERSFLSINFREKGKGRTLRFSTHRTSPENDKIRKEILMAKNKKEGSL
jgi:hypothetical protein